MKVWRLLVPIAAFVVAAAAMLPLRVAWALAPASAALDVSGLHGTIWSGQATGVSWNGIDLGDFDTSMDVLNLLPSPLLRLTEGTGPLKSAGVRASGDAISISSADVRLSLSSLDARLPTVAMLRLLEGRLDLDGGACSQASGRVSVDAAPQVGLPALTGELACKAGEIVVSVSTPAGGRALIAIPIESGRPPIALEASPELALALALLGVPVGGSEPS